MRDLNRRGVIGLVGGAAAWPLAARAVQGLYPTNKCGTEFAAFMRREFAK